MCVCVCVSVCVHCKKVMVDATHLGYLMQLRSTCSMTVTGSTTIQTGNIVLISKSSPTHTNVKYATPTVSCN